MNNWFIWNLDIKNGEKKYETDINKYETDIDRCFDSIETTKSIEKRLKKL